MTRLALDANGDMKALVHLWWLVLFQVAWKFFRPPSVSKLSSLERMKCRHRVSRMESGGANMIAYRSCDGEASRHLEDDIISFHLPGKQTGRARLSDGAH